MPKLLLRTLEAADLSIRVAWFNTSSVSEHMALEIPLSIADTQQWFAQNRLSRSRKDFVAELEANREITLAAMFGLIGLHVRDRNAELYIVVNPTMTQKGIGQKVVQWLCNYGFNHLGLERIYLYTMPDNHIARHVYEKNGFVFEGTLRHHVFHAGTFKDRYVHGILREDWKKQPWHIESIVPLEVDL